MNPTVGRIVHFCNGVSPVWHAAIITAVDNYRPDEACMTVFPECIEYHAVRHESVRGDGPRWRWPPRS